MPGHLMAKPWIAQVGLKLEQQQLGRGYMGPRLVRRLASEPQVAFELDGNAVVGVKPRAEDRVALVATEVFEALPRPRPHLPSPAQLLSEPLQ